MADLKEYDPSIRGWLRCLWEDHEYTAKREIYTTYELGKSYVMYNRCCEHCGKPDGSSAEYLERVVEGEYE